jgi:hypothetical protein
MVVSHATGYCCVHKAAATGIPENADLIAEIKPGGGAD